MRNVPFSHLKFVALFVVAAGILSSSAVWALSSDNDQPMNVESHTFKRIDSKTGSASDPAITHLDGDVVITQGSIKSHADHAVIYEIPSGSKDPNAGKYSHIVLTGKQAHMQQVHDGDCGVMTADADTIDYKPLTHIAEMTGNVKVVQAGHGESRSEHMIYNTDTGDMESGDSSPTSRVKITMEPKTAQPAAASTTNCGFKIATPRAAKAVDKKTEKN